MILAKDPCVLIAGAGPVGLTLAADLLRRGISCRVLEREVARPPWSRASLLQARTLELLDDLGVADEVLARGRRIHGLSLYADGKRLSHVRLDEAGSMDTPYPFILSLTQREMERVLSDLVARLGGVVERGVHLVGLSQDGALVRAELRRADGQTELARAQWLVGCDGAFSTVRESLGLPFEGEDYGQVMLQGDVHIEWPAALPDDEAVAFFSPAGAIAAVPLRAPGRWRLMALQPQTSDVEPSPANLQALLCARGPRGAILGDPEGLASFPIRRRLASYFRVGRVFLAGDAAHLQSPLSGQGMNLGMQDAYNLGWKLGLVARGDADPRLLDSYEEERLPEAADALETADELTRTFATVMTMPGTGARSLRAQVFSTLQAQEDFPRRVSRAAGMLTASYRSTIIGEYWGADAAPDGDSGPYDFGPGPQPGDHAPDLALSVPLGGRHRLRQLLHGPLHTLLIFAGIDDYRGAASLLATAEQIARRYGQLVRSYAIVPAARLPADAPEGAPLVLDADAAIHRRYGARGECLYLVRPDEYIGFRGHPARTGPLFAYLDRLLGQEAPEDSASAVGTVLA